MYKVKGVNLLPTRTIIACDEELGLRSGDTLIVKEIELISYSAGLIELVLTSTDDAGAEKTNKLAYSGHYMLWWDKVDG